MKVRTSQLVKTAVCVLVEGKVTSINSTSINVSGHPPIIISQEWMTNSARSQLYEVKVGDNVVLGVVEDDDSWFAVELHSDESAIRIRRDLWQNRLQSIAKRL